MWLESIPKSKNNTEKCPTCGGCVQRRDYGEVYAGAFILDGERLEIRRIPNEWHRDPIVLDSLVQYFNGHIYRVYPLQHYFTKGGSLLHRDVWKNAFDEIPKGCHIHHKDDDKKIIPFQTLSAYLQKNICPYLGKNIRWGKLNTSHLWLEKKLLNGIRRMKGVFGIKDRLKDAERGKNGKEKTGRVCFVKKYFHALLERMDYLKNSALIIANPLSIDAVRKLENKQDVWCLTVPDIEHFSLSNGAIVHNCSDAWRYMAIIWRDQFTQLGQNTPRRYDSAVDAGHHRY